MTTKLKRTRKRQRPQPLRAARGSAPDSNGEYRANFLWPHEAGSVEEAGYEFGNGKTQEYQKFWWDILLERAKAPNDELTHRRPKDVARESGTEDAIGGCVQ